MAYLDLNADGLNIPIGRSLPLPVMFEGRKLSQIEREAVRLARSDGAGSLYGAGRLRRLAVRCFGLRTPNKLADPQLEALRRFAVAVAHDGAASIAREREQLRMLGRTEGLIEQVESLALSYRPKPRASTGVTRALGLATCLAIGTGLLDRFFGDLLVSFMTVSTVSLPVWPLVMRR